GGLASSGISQLLAYLAGVQDARSAAGRINYTIFDVATDSNVFEFVVLRRNRRAYVSDPFRWSTGRSPVIAFFITFFISFSLQDERVRCYLEMHHSNCSESGKSSRQDLKQWMPKLPVILLLRGMLS